MKLFWFILALSIFLRFYNLSRFAGFSWDQEQLLAYPVKKIIVNQKLSLIGPQTGPGGIHLGPLIYYLAVPFFWVFKLHPIAGSVLASVLGIVTGALFYYLVYKLFNHRLAIIAYALYAASPLTNFNDRTIWNPSLIPLASLGVLAVQLTWLKRQQISHKSLILLATSIALGIQAHLGFIFSLPVIALTLVYLRLPKQLNLSKIFCFLFIFLIWFSPLIAFDLRHQAVNLNSLLKFLSSGNANLNLVKLIIKFINLLKSSLQLIGSVLIASSLSQVKLLLGFSFAASAALLRRKINSNLTDLFLIWLLVYSLGFSFYRGNVPEYYLWPILIPAILIYALIIAQLIRKFRLHHSVFTITLLFFLSFSSLELVSASSPDSLYNKLSAVRFMIDRAPQKNFRVLYDTDFGRNYGFDYIFDYYATTPSTNPADPAFVVVIPEFFRNGQHADQAFGSIGIFYPQ